MISTREMCGKWRSLHFLWIPFFIVSLTIQSGPGQAKVVGGSGSGSGSTSFRGIGEACVEKSYWERDQRGTCDDRRGFSCQNYPEYGGWVCACSSPFVYDPHSDECRRRLRGTCQHPSLSFFYHDDYSPPSSASTEIRGIYPRPSKMKVKPPLAWYDKCQQNAECTVSAAVSGNPAGICQCKRGFNPSYGGDFCE